MPSPLTQPKGHLALDMGWRTASVGALFLGFCPIAIGVSAWRVLTGAPVELRVTWHTAFLLSVSVWFAFKIHVRIARFALGLLAISSASQIAFEVAQASVQTQVLNAEIMRVVDLVVMVGFSSPIGSGSGLSGSRIRSGRKNHRSGE
jgi:hypothetical protein